VEKPWIAAVPKAVSARRGMMKTILFVDDNEVLARMSCEILRRHGYRAECSYNGRDALSRFDGESFDLLVTDYRMEGMNGVELAGLVREKAPGIPIIIVTGYAPDKKSDTVDAWLEKQEMFPALLEKVDLLLGEGDASKTPSRA
jgi:CheY-like chemotaxis protein